MTRRIACTDTLTRPSATYWRGCCSNPHFARFTKIGKPWRGVVGIMHASFGRTPDDPAGVAVIEQLRAASPQFTAWWNDFRLARYEPSARVIVHPQLGRLSLLFTAFIASSMDQRDGSLMIVLQSPLDDDTRERLRA